MRHTSSVEELRNKQKAAFAYKFNEITNSSTFKATKNKLGLNEYKFMLISEAYKFQLIDLACYGYSILGNHSTATIFQLNVFDRYKDWGKNKVNHFLKTGLMCIAIDKNNVVAASVGHIDLFDKESQSHVHNDNDPLPLKILHKKECSAYAARMYCQQNKQFKKIFNNEININDLYLYYGEWVEGTLMCARPDIRKTGLAFLLFNLQLNILMELGYKYAIYRLSNTRSLSLFPKGVKQQIVYQFKFYDYVFNDGTKMKKYFDELRDKWKYNEKQIEKLKQTHYYLVIQNFKRVLGDCDWRTRLKNAVNSKINYNKSKL